jgi:hypothetical protein
LRRLAVLAKFMAILIVAVTIKIAFELKLVRAVPKSLQFVCFGTGGAL